MFNPPPNFLWHNGQIKPWAEATVHVSVHALHYGSSVFEGVRAYETPQGAQIFRLHDHTDRLFHSARVYEIDMPYSEEEIRTACKQAVTANGLRSAYLRPIAFRGYGALGVYAEVPTEVSVLAFSWGSLLGKDALEHGVDVCVSSWQRCAPNTLPAMAKAGGNYLSSQLVTREAHRLGFHEGIALGANGLLSEGAGENLFLVMKGKLYTPPCSAGVLAGITRDSVMTLAADLGIETIERDMPRESLYFADEVFLTGTAAEITPVRSVDRKLVGKGGRGPITQRLQEAFFGLFNGRTEDRHHWLTPVGAEAETTAAEPMREVA